jgi:hypothetical protein
MTGCGFTMAGGIPLAAVSVSRVRLAGNTTKPMTTENATARSARRINDREFRLRRIAKRRLG